MLEIIKQINQACNYQILYYKIKRKSLSILKVKWKYYQLIERNKCKNLNCYSNKLETKSNNLY